MLEYVLLGALAASVVVAQDRPGADEVTGSLTIDGKTFALTHIYAELVKDDSDKTKTMTRVTITTRAVPARAREEELGVYDLARETDLHGVRIDYRDGGSSMSLIVISGLIEGSLSFSRSGSNVTPDVFTPTRIVGTAEIAERTMGSTTIAMNAEFSATVSPLVVVAEPTAAETAAAQTMSSTKAYLALVKAIHAGDKAAILAAAPPEQRSMMDTPEFAQMLPMVQSMVPKVVRVLKATETAEEATLLAATDDLDGRPARGKIKLTRGPNGEWFMAGESWGTP